MVKIQFEFKDAYFRGNAVRISEEQNNAFVFKPTGAIGLTLNGSSGNARNTPGNGIDGTVNQSIPIIRLNNTVSRKVSTDPTPANEGVNIPAFVSAWLTHISNP